VGVYRDVEEADRYVERSWSFMVEHLRQHERATKGDREVEERLRCTADGAQRAAPRFCRSSHIRDVHDNGPT